MEWSSVYNLSVRYRLGVFRADTLKDAIAYIGIMFGVKSASLLPFAWEYYVTPKVWFVLVLCILFSGPFWHRINFAGINKKAKLCLENIALVGILLLSMASLAASTYNPFIYFRF